ncbi:hypothetical protein J6590_036197 [Homalodisca vitripennis]|nr:hypothetical protein J6590_036197 [Homalodisca vitripennis]
MKVEDVTNHEFIILLWRERHTLMFKGGVGYNVTALAVSCGPTGAKCRLPIQEASVVNCGIMMTVPTTCGG